jgi:hypothetical protein
MSALSAEVTELSQIPVAARPVVTGAPQRAERRAQRARERRSRRLWAACALAVIGCFFGLTVGILDVLH